MKHIAERWQGGNSENPTRLWAHQPGASVIIADFSVSKNLRHETQVANCRRARAAVNFANGASTEVIERLNARGVTLKDALALLSECIGRMRDESGSEDPMHAFSFDRAWEDWAKRVDRCIA